MSQDGWTLRASSQKSCGSARSVQQTKTHLPPSAVFSVPDILHGFGAQFESYDGSTTASQVTRITEDSQELAGSSHQQQTVSNNTQHSTDMKLWPSTSSDDNNNAITPQYNISWEYNRLDRQAQSHTYTQIPYTQNEYTQVIVDDPDGQHSQNKRYYNNRQTSSTHIQNATAGQLDSPSAASHPCSNSADEYVFITERSSIQSLDHFGKKIPSMLGDQYSDWTLVDAHSVGGEDS